MNPLALNLLLGLVLPSLGFLLYGIHGLLISILISLALQIILARQYLKSVSVKTTLDIDQLPTIMLIGLLLGIIINIGKGVKEKKIIYPILSIFWVSLLGFLLYMISLQIALRSL